MTDCTYLFACFDDFLQVIFGGQPLDGGERLPAVPLLNADVYQAALRAFIEALTCSSKGVCE